MKKILAALLALIASTAFGTTLNPVQLLNPAGSTSGQAIVSTGASSAPAWGNVSATALAAQAANTVLANATASSASPTAFAMPSCSTSTSALRWTSGTGFVCLTTVANLTGSTFTGFLTLSYSNPAANINDTSGTNQAALTFQKSGTTQWYLTNTSSSGLFGLNRVVGGSYVDSPITVSNSTGVVTMVDGLTSAGGINSTAIGATTPSTGAFTTLSASSTITPSQTAGIVGTTTNNNANAGSVGEYVTATANAVALTNNTTANVTSISLTAGDWDVWGTVSFVPAGTTVETARQAGITTTSATMPVPNGTSTLLSFSVTGLTNTVTVVPQRISLSATTTVYLVAQASFTTSTDAGYGFIGARRVR